MQTLLRKIRTQFKYYNLSKLDYTTFFKVYLILID